MTLANINYRQFCFWSLAVHSITHTAYIHLLTCTCSSHRKWINIDPTVHSSGIFNPKSVPAQKVWVSATERDSWSKPTFIRKTLEKGEQDRWKTSTLFALYPATWLQTAHSALLFFYRKPLQKDKKEDSWEYAMLSLQRGQKSLLYVRGGWNRLKKREEERCSPP